jgi:hypothetical protein
MKKFIKNIKADRWTFRGFNISLFLTFLTTLFIIINYTNLPPFVPIFNQLPWGTPRLTGTPGIFIPIIVFIVIFVVNLIFTSIVYPKNPLLARIVAATTLLIAILNFLFIIRTILVIL